MSRPTLDKRLLSLVALIWLAFIVRGTFYATVFPLWEPFDEYAHFAFIHHLSAFGALPRPDERVSAEINRSLQIAPLPWTLKDWPAPSVTHDAFWNLSDEDRLQRQEALRSLPAVLQANTEGQFLYEGKQPPLFYALAALGLKLLPASTLATRIFVLRFFCVLIASLIVPLTFAVTRRLFQDGVPGVLAAALVSSMPGLLINISRVSNDSLAIVLFSVLTYALLRRDPWDTPGMLLIGITLGAGLLTKAYFIAAIPAVIWSGASAIWKGSSGKHGIVLVRTMIAAALAFAVSGWWYVSILRSDGPVWADVAPSGEDPLSALWSYLSGMHWWQGVRVDLNTHFWTGGWSFLGVRSWIYSVLRGIFLLSFLASLFWMFRNRSRLGIVWCLYGAFWVALVFHGFVNFVNSGLPVSTGWYLYAVVTCEAAILVSAVAGLPPRWRSSPLTSLTALFLLLETYATHFVLIPYYIGLIHHRPDGTVTTFYVSQALEQGWQSILSRLVINKESFIGPWMMAGLWAAFLLASISIFAVAWTVRGGKVAMKRDSAQGVR